MSEEYVIVPKKLLDNLEIERKRLYDIIEEKLPEDNISKMISISSVSRSMWILSNTRWPAYEKS
jgi:hypothetical protein